jgi:curved DNA-binding protein CbpA
MRSAYVTLGVPGNASADEIKDAFERARAFYTPARLASAEGAVDKFNELKTAYEVLRNEDSRAAHDRKLATAVQRPRQASARTVVAEEEPRSRKLLWAGVAVVALVFGAGFFISNKNAETRRHQAALELEQQKQEAKKAEEDRLAAEKADRERAAARAKAESDDQRFQRESQMVANRATSQRIVQEAIGVQSQRMAIADAQRQEAARQAEERRNAMEARNRVEADKRRVRELCLQLYRRPDC